MPAYNIPCADGKNVTLTITKADPVNRVLRNLKRYHGLDSDHVMAEIFGNYTSANVTFETDPDKMHSMLLAFWTGYEMAKH